LKISAKCPDEPGRGNERLSHVFCEQLAGAGRYFVFVIRLICFVVDNYREL
jgi:hypothetical protein